MLEPGEFAGKQRAALEARNLQMGAVLILDVDTIPDAAALTTLAQKFNKKDVL